MRVSGKLLNPILKDQLAKTLAQTLTDLKDPKDTLIFLQNFFNDSELETFAKRLAIAYWLKKGRSYSNIKENLKVSSATIATIQGLIDTPGIKIALKQMEAEEWANVWSERIKKVVG